MVAKKRGSVRGRALQARPPRIAAVVRAQLVDLVDMNTGFLLPACFIPAKCALAWRPHRCDGAANLGLVAHAAQGDAHELAAQSRAIERPSEACLPGRAEGNKAGVHVPRPQLVHRQVVEDAFLTFSRLYGLVEHGACGAQITGSSPVPSTAARP